MTFLSDAGLLLKDEEPYLAIAPQLLQLDQKVLDHLGRVKDGHYLTGQILHNAYASVLLAGTSDEDLEANHESVLIEAQAWRQWLT